MKKIIVTIIILVILIGTGTTYFVLTKDKKEPKEKTEKKPEVVPDLEPEEEKYVDDNPIVVGLYTKKDGLNFKLVTEHSNVWKRSVDIGSFTVFATHDSIPNSAQLQSTWWKYWNSYENADDYKIGYNIRYTTSNGEEMDRNILSPSDTNFPQRHLFVYLYDSANATPGVWYSHLEPKDVKETTKYSTIKLTGHDNTSTFLSPIELTVFTYKDENDFEPDTGKYRGNSFYTVIINQNK